MSEWAPKRFWTSADVKETETGFAVVLDGRPVRTPAKAVLEVPSRAIAEKIASEFAAQDDRIDPGTMPFTKTANAAIDKVALQLLEVADLLAEYGDSDLLCYRADAPEALVERQNMVWDPLLEWAERELNAKLEPRVGVMHAPQDPAAISELRERVRAMNAFELAAFHDLVAISGSLVIGFAAKSGDHPIDELWSASRVDEDWQQEQWGEDEEAVEMAKHKQAAFLHAFDFLRLLNGQSGA
ncbi:ATP12 family protein [Marivita sp. XM-24bin2]|jgi:chaperone required for assembly of F1-ATPase|uniref:ATP12 family chaperone protein n=1 Tax=unclassified Marivita TaxID=2632480 RepID=UPI000D7ACFE2|nr:ATP12 family protein [Marivita sp. XM-24bin2]MCR9107863.1 ATPase [Paracoccaceae bacterium]PWL34360.1 MAG: ATPase [Marivita sp. XM-24bin2]